MLSNTIDRESEVAPFVGAWIEIQSATVGMLAVIVAPFVGAWIEMHCIQV